MINMSTVNAAVLSLLEANLPANKYKVKRAAYINMDSNNTPWVGIYRGPASYEPRSIASHQSGKKWRATPVLRLLVQSSSGKSGVQAEERLEEYVAEVTDVILANPNINGTVKTIISVDVDYSYNEEQSETVYFQMATIDLTLEGRT